jgi:hypothetical protein
MVDPPDIRDRLPCFFAIDKARKHLLNLLGFMRCAMAYDPGALDAALAAAVGDDPALMLELRAALLGSAQKHFDMLCGARNDATWYLAATRLQGLAASFGAMQLLAAANETLEAAPGDPVSTRRVGRALDRLSNDRPN